MHWCNVHDYKICNLCPSYAFKYDSDRIQHEQLHLPFGCSSCDHEFTKYCQQTISEHYKKSHQSFLCQFCSGVIQPYSKYPEHVEKKHNTLSYTKLTEHKDKIYEIFDGGDGPYFNCLMCDKKKDCSLIFGHFIFYHNLSVHALKKYFDKTPQIKVNGSALNSAGIPDVEDIAVKDDSPVEKEKDDCKEKCSVCDKTVDEEVFKAKELHGVFCQGNVVCSQKECNRIFKTDNALTQHIEKEHQATSCKFGCNEKALNPLEISDHLQNLHDIIECFLCNIINSSGSFKNHLRDQHSVNLMVFEKAMSKANSKLFRVEKGESSLH